MPGKKAPSTPTANLQPSLGPRLLHGSPGNHVPDSVYEEVRKQFSDKELADLTLAIATINAWNRLAIASRTVPGTYEVPKPCMQKSAQARRR